ncbi:sensor histidine kinase [Shewanella waksmanii]|uniref:sensor histidine kinase n=1 Tax=Shewanella waksmanii TaxID=213783 RepID=UPI00048D721E|nr:two-component regulator propeller domain-containing protein [Shewanella waksmanii]
MRPLLLLIICCFSFFSSAAQFSPRFDTFGVDEGLSMNTVNDVVHDQQGYLWVATQAGLNRFDGKQFIQYNPKANGLGPSKKHITKLYYGEQQRLWLITRSDGINLYLPQSDSFTYFNQANSGIPNNHIVDLLEDTNGHLWIATADQGLIYFDPETKKILKHYRYDGTSHALISDSITGLFQDRFNRMWLSFVNGLMVFDSAQDQFIAVDVSVINGNITQLEQAPRNEIWIASSTGELWLLNVESRQLKPIALAEDKPNSAISSLKYDGIDTLWVAYANQGVALYDIKHQQTSWLKHSHSHPFSLSSPLVNVLWLDDERQMWIGTQGGGLNKANLNAAFFGHLHPYSFDKNNLRNKDVRAIALHNSQLYVGTAKGVFVTTLDEQGHASSFKKFDPSNSRLSNGFISFIELGPQGKLWFGTRGDGLFIYSAEGDYRHLHHTPQTPQSVDYLATNQLYALYFDPQGDGWLTTKDAGFYRFTKGTTTPQHYQHNENIINSLPTNALTDVTQDRRGHTWFTSYQDGLVELTAEGQFNHYIDAALPSNHLFNIVAGDDNLLWIASSDGLIKFDSTSKQSQLFTKADGLIGDTVYLLTQDATHQLWLGTANGLTRFNPKNQQVVNFTRDDGIQDNEFNFGASFLSQDGWLYLGGINGFNHFQPSQVRLGSAPRRPIIDALYILDKRVPLPTSTSNNLQKGNRAATLKLHYNDDIFSLHFNSPSLRAASYLKYEYRMIGLSETWLPSPDGQFIYFTGLKPGAYLFQVRARDLNGNLSPNKQLKIIIPPAPWLSPLAYVMYALLVVLTIAGLFYRKHRQFKQQAQVLSRIENSEQRLLLALWGSGDEFWDWDLVAKRTVRTNSFLNYPKDNVSLKQVLAQCIHPEDVDEIQQQLDSCLENRSDKFSIAYRARGENDQWIWVLNRGQVVSRDANLKPTRIAGTIKNIQQLKQSELALKQLNSDLEDRVKARTQDLEQSNQELTDTLASLDHAQTELIDKEKMAALGGLVASITHEINTPIGISVTAASHLQESVKRFNTAYANEDVSHDDFELYQKEVAECSQLMLTNLGRASRLIKSFKQVSVDQSHEDVRQFDLHVYLEEIFVSLNPLLSRTQHHYEYQCPESLQITSNPGAFYQIISNLFNNSVIHAYPDGNSGHLSLQVEQTAEAIVMTYQDDGCGMSDEVKNHIFAPFYTTKRGKGGSGLGMNIVYNLVNQVLGGNIEVESAPQQGTRFIITLPLSLLAQAKS